MELKTLTKTISCNAYEINALNRRPIEINTLVSFITTPLTKEIGTLGYITYQNEEHSLILSGVFTNRIEYLDHIEYKNNLNNVYNNWVNLFSLFDILTDEGKRFVFEYHQPEIQLLLQDRRKKVERYAMELEASQHSLNILEKEISSIEFLFRNRIQ